MKVIPARIAPKVTVIVAGMLVGAGVGLWAWLQRVPDPIVRGKALSEHLATLRINGAGVTWDIESPSGVRVEFQETPDPEVELAIRQSSTNALALLGNMLRAKARPGETVLWRQAWKLAARHPGLKRHLGGLNPAGRALNEQIRAVYVLQHLGSNALPLIPQIVPLLRDPECANSAVKALLAIGPTRADDILQITNCFGIRPSVDGGNAEALFALARFGSNSALASPYFLSFVSSTNGWASEWVRGAAALASGASGTGAEIVIPSVIRELDRLISIDSISTRRSGRVEVDPAGPIPIRLLWIEPISKRRSWLTEVDPTRPIPMQIQALGEYGAAASNAIPLLEHIAGVEGPLQKPASNALVRIRNALAVRRAGPN